MSDLKEPKAALRHYLQSNRDALLWKLDGLGEHDLRMPRTPTGTNLIGIVKHMANDVEKKGPAVNDPWRGHPFNVRNNVNGIDGDPGRDGSGRATHTLDNERVTRLQEAYVRRVVDAIADQPNVLFEISNESTSGSMAWQNHMVAVIEAHERARSLHHPVGVSAEYPGGSNDDLLESAGTWIAPNGSVDDPDAADGRKVVIADTDHLCESAAMGRFPGEHSLVV